MVRNSRGRSLTFLLLREEFVRVSILQRKCYFVLIKISGVKKSALDSFSTSHQREKVIALTTFIMHKLKHLYMKSSVKQQFTENKVPGRKIQTNKQRKLRVPVRIPVKATLSLLSLMWKKLLSPEILHYILWSVIKQGWNKQDSSVFRHWYVPCSKCIKRKYFHHTIIE